MKGPTRRHAIGALIGGAIAGVGALLPGKRAHADTTLRPPGAGTEDEFLSACSRCFKCGDACPNGCIQFFDLGGGFDRVFTPFIKARTRGCILCGECAKACPTGALTPFDVSRDGWLAGVSMGTARVNKDLCYSFHGRTCGACYRACPLAGQAMKIGVFEIPLVQPDNCVGCGLCEQACLHLPQAIRIIPRRT